MLSELSANLIIFGHDLIYTNYSQDDSSEGFIGEWAEKRGIRDQLVLATKVHLSVLISPAFRLERRFSIRPITSVAKRNTW